MDCLSNTQIARLVLGYLKQENCKVSYYRFLKECKHFERITDRKQKIITRYNGLALVDILNQYREIYCIVQEYLEETDYYKTARKSIDFLPEQLLYILQNLAKNLRSHTSTPTSFAESKSPEGEDNLAFSSLEKSGLETSATSLMNLPGNSLENISIKSKLGKSSVKKNSHASTETERTEYEESSSGEMDKSGQIEKCVQAFAKKILKNTELQTKIADNINSVLLDIEKSQEPVNQNHSVSEVLESEIKQVLDKTQSDPVFESLLSDLLGEPSIPKLQEPKPVEAELKNPPNIIIENMEVDSAVGNQQANLVTAVQPVQSAGADNMTQPIIFIGTPAFGPYIMQNSLSEQDILSMPVIIPENVQTESTPQVEQGTQKKKKAAKNCRSTKKKIDNLHDYITIYKYSDSPDVSINSDQPSTSADTPVAVLQVESLPEVEVVEETKKAENKTPTRKHKVKTPNSKSSKSDPKSHVRALDFKFNTPGKEIMKVLKNDTSPKMPKCAKTKTAVKTLFSESSSTTKTNADVKKETWDAKIRAMVSGDQKFEAKDDESEEKVDQCEEKNDECDDKLEENVSNENVDLINVNAASVSSNVKAAPRQTRSKSSKTPHKIKVAKTINETTPLNKNIRSKKNEEAPKNEESKSNKQLKTCENKSSAEKDTLIKVGQQPNFKRKCNANSFTRDLNEVQTEKKILSPSKLKGNKKTIIECVEVLKQQEETLVVESESATKLEPSAVPEVFPKVLPVLETPGKDICPKTPSIFTPMLNIEDTPFTKVFKEQISGVDIDKIGTPKCLLTPSFAITPYVDGCETSGPMNRPTDYSTSSSYYQPSDTEQSKSLEVAIIEECSRFENKTPNPALSPKNNEQSEETRVQTEKVIVATMKSMSSNAHGRKNLNLMKSKEFNTSNLSDSSVSSNSSSSSSDSSSSAASSLDELSDTEESKNTTVVRVQIDESMNSRYPLRSRSEDATEDITGILNKVDFVPALQAAEKKEEIDGQTKLLQDLAAKKQRVLDGLKQDAKVEKFVKKSSGGKVVPKKPPNEPKKVTGRVLRSSALRKEYIKSLKQIDAEDKKQEDKSEKEEVELCSSKEDLNTAAPPSKAIKKSKKVSSKTPVKKSLSASKKSDKMKKSPAKEIKASKVSPKQTQKNKKKDSKTKNKPENKPVEEERHLAPKHQKTSEEIIKSTEKPRENPSSTKAIKQPDTTKSEKPVESSKKGTTGSEAENLVNSLKERGILLMHVQNQRKVEQLEEGEIPSSETEEAADEDTLGRCLKYLRTPDEDMVFLDTRVFTEPHVTVYSDSLARKKRDSTKDKELLAKSRAASVYDEETDSEVTRLMKATPFRNLIEIKLKPETGFTGSERAVKVLDDVVIKSSINNFSTQRNKTDNLSKKRRLKEELNSGDAKKSKPNNEFQALLQNVQIEDVLGKLHKQ